MTKDIIMLKAFLGDWIRKSELDEKTYCCFSKNDILIYVGNRYIERSDESVAVDYILDEKAALEYLKV